MLWLTIFTLRREVLVRLKLDFTFSKEIEFYEFQRKTLKLVTSSETKIDLKISRNLSAALISHFPHFPLAEFG